MKNKYCFMIYWNQRYNNRRIFFPRPHSCRAFLWNIDVIQMYWTYPAEEKNLMEACDTTTKNNNKTTTIISIMCIKYLKHIQHNIKIRIVLSYKLLMKCKCFTTTFSKCLVNLCGLIIVHSTFADVYGIIILF